MKLKVTITLEKEAEIDPDLYPEGLSYHQIADLEYGTIEANPHAFIEMCEPKCTNVNVQLVGDGENEQ